MNDTVKLKVAPSDEIISQLKDATKNRDNRTYNRLIGPAKRLIFEPAKRLNLITGDNGLGKTFLLECAKSLNNEQ